MLKLKTGSNTGSGTLIRDAETQFHHSVITQRHSQQCQQCCYVQKYNCVLDSCYWQRDANHIISYHHIEDLKRQNRLKVGTNKLKLKAKMQSVSDDDVRKRLLEKPRFELAAKGVFRLGRCYIFWQGVPGLRASNCMGKHGVGYRRLIASQYYANSRSYITLQCDRLKQWIHCTVCGKRIEQTPWVFDRT